MYKKIFIMNVLAFLILFFFGCQTGPQLSPMQIRQLTTRTIEGSYENVYRATLTVLQDQGYILKSTDMNSGLIVATVDRATSGGSQFMQGLFSGYVSDKGTMVEISCMVNKLNETSNDLRINIQETKYGQSSQWSGTGTQDVKRIYDEKVYQGLFNQILTEVKRREAINPIEKQPEQK